MAVKVRCPSCSKSLNAPDAAKGKAVKCPGCGGKVSVPAGESTSSKAGAGTAKTKAKASKSALDADFLAALDAAGVEDQNIRLCVRCGAHLTPDMEECPECGVDARTGNLSARKRRKLGQKGPDTDLFWSAAWSEPWAFLKEYWGIPVKLGVMLSLFSMISNFAAFAVVRYCDLVNSPPPAVFWLGVSIFFAIGIPGMLATIMQQIVVHSMEEREKTFHPKYDMFGALANGVKFIAWFVIMPLPFAIFFGLSYLLPFVAFPIAVIHMTRPYAHPAWLPWDMLRLTGKNIGACLYMFVMALALLLPAIAVGVVLAILSGSLMPTIAGWLAQGTGWLASMMGDTSRDGFLFMMFEAMLVLIFTFLIAVPLYMVLCFPSVFLMRAIGEFGYYFKNRLELVNKIPKNQLAGFWPRYLAYMIDGTIVGLMNLVFSGAALGMCAAYAWINGVALLEFVEGPTGRGIQGLVGLLYIVATMYYWAGGESSAVQGTLGMRAIGLKVVDMKFNRIPFGTGVSRWLMRNIGGFILFMGWIMCAFTEKKQTLHDLSTKTLVVWEGD